MTFLPFFFSRTFIPLGVLSFCYPWVPTEEWPLFACHPLLQSAGLSGLLTAVIQVSFYALMTGLLKSDSSRKDNLFA